MQPTIYHAKRLIKAFAKERDLELICDLHGHSRRMKIFMYGCEITDRPALTRTFPYLLSKVSPFFDYKSCSFHMQKSKESTLRISMFKETQIPNVFTLEASFCGDNGIHFNTSDLMLMGKQLCLTLLVNGDLTMPAEIKMNKTELVAELNSNEELLASNNTDDSGSESEPSEDNLDEETLKTLIPKTVTKKKKKSRNDKKSISTIRKRESLPAKSERKSESVEKKNEKKKCAECGEFEGIHHVCNKKILKNFSPSPGLYSKRERMIPSSLSHVSVYINLKGKKVRDQATQTMYVRKMPDTTLKNNHSASLINGFDRTPSPTKYRLDNYIDTKMLKKVIEFDEFYLPSLKYQIGGQRYPSPDKLGKIY